MGVVHIRTPLDEETVLSLKAGDRVLLSGTVYAARDAAHKRMSEMIEKGEPLPLPLQGQVIYYVGPSPAAPGHVIGATGPTTSGRMDKYTPALLALGLKGMIGKGYRDEEVVKAIARHKAVYFAATGGAGALLASRIRKNETIAFEDLGPEAIRKLEVEEFPLIVINDAYGNDYYRQIADSAD